MRNVRLPSGSDPVPIQWYPLTLDGTLPEPQLGGTSPAVSTMLDEVPVFVRGGAILPLRELENYVGEKLKAPLTLQVYPGPDNTHQLYLDDGVTNEYDTNGAFRLVTISATTIPGKPAKAVRVQRQEDRFSPAEDFFFVRWIGVPVTPTSVAAGSNPIAQAASAAALAANDSNGWFYDPIDKNLTVKLFDNVSDVTIDVA